MGQRGRSAATRVRTVGLTAAVGPATGAVVVEAETNGLVGVRFDAVGSR
jgi:hypothetical protein